MADAGYSNSDYNLTPYCGVRYHLKEQALANRKPENKEELFNLLQNIIKRFFGVYKQCFWYFDSAAEFLWLIQIKLVFALTAVHNFIWQYSQEEDLYENQEIMGEDHRKFKQDQPETYICLTKSSSKKMDKYREEIAKVMWKNYVDYIVTQNLLI